jgi:methionine-rich copper-binding protein CopC/putative copper export protein
MRWRALAAVAAAVGALGLPALAYPHPRLMSSTPEPDAVLSGSLPTVVSLRFNEDAEPVGGGISVTAPDGHEVAVGSVKRDGRILRRAIHTRGHGTYLVEWLAVGGDTHPARGAYVFSIGERTLSGVPGGSHAGIALQAAGRWLSLAGFALGFGVPLAVAAALAGAMTRRLWRLVWLGILLMVLAEPISLLGQTATLQPSHAFDVHLAGDILLTSYGHVTGLRLGGALALWALAGAVRQAPARALWGIPALGLGLAVVHADATHRIPGLSAPVSFALAALHVAAAGVWLGCVVVALAGPAGSVRRVVRFAVAAAGVLVLSGVVLAIGHFGALADLVETAYGEAFLAKLVVVAIALALGALAKHRAELIAAAGVLAAATVLVSLLPPP